MIQETRIAIESSNELNDNELDYIVNVWNEKLRRIAVWKRFLN